MQKGLNDKPKPGYFKKPYCSYDLYAAIWFEKIKKRTCSFGVSRFNSSDTVESIIKRVDDALYEAKRKGRNQVVFR